MAGKWEQLRERLEVKEANARKQAKPTDATLDKFERDYELPLPGDYRTFVKVFGPGELAGVVRIYAPVGKKKPGDSSTFVDGFREGIDFLSDVFGDPKIIGRAVPFANTIFGDMIVWDPAKKTDEGSHEYEILLLSKERSKIVKLAPNFDTFINKRCLSSEFGKYLDDPEYRPDNTFVEFAALGPK